jgi:hypothetical protein
MRPRCRTVGPPGVSAARPLPAGSTAARRPSRLSITCDIQPFLQSQPGSPSTRPASAASDRISHGHLQESNVIPTRPQPPQPASNHEQDAATRAHPTPPFGRPSRPSPCIPEGSGLLSRCWVRLQRRSDRGQADSAAVHSFAALLGHGAVRPQETGAVKSSASPGGSHCRGRARVLLRSESSHAA